MKNPFVCYPRKCVFLLLFIILSGNFYNNTPSGRQTPPPRQTPPIKQPLQRTVRIYWNAFLFFYIITVLNYGDSLSVTISLLIGKWIDNRVNHSRMCCHLVHRSHEVWMTLCSVYSHVNETVQWVTYFGSLQRSLEIKSWASSEISSKRSSGNSRFTWNKNVHRSTR